MTQLRQEGWIHHLARHAVACFLTRGDLWISWEEGQKVCVLALSTESVLPPVTHLADSLQQRFLITNF